MFFLIFFINFQCSLSYKTFEKTSGNRRANGPVLEALNINARKHVLGIVANIATNPNDKHVRLLARLSLMLSDFLSPSHPC